MNKSARYTVRSTMYDKTGGASFIREQVVSEEDSVQNCVRRHSRYMAIALDKMKYDSDNHHHFSIEVRREN